MWTLVAAAAAQLLSYVLQRAEDKREIYKIIFDAIDKRPITEVVDLDKDLHDQIKRIKESLS